jgi:hypothetical protein
MFALFVSLLLAAGCNRSDVQAPQSAAPRSEAQSEDGTNVVLVYTASDDNTCYKFQVARSTIENLPGWSPASNSIPLQPQLAAQLALKRYKSIYPTATNLMASEIELSAGPHFLDQW